MNIIGSVIPISPSYTCLHYELQLAHQQRDELIDVLRALLDNISAGMCCEWEDPVLKRAEELLARLK